MMPGAQTIRIASFCLVLGMTPHPFAYGIVNSSVARNLSPEELNAYCFTMASGVEAAGLVLGSLPLLIAALEHYEDIIQPTRAFFAWRRHRKMLRQELLTLRASFDQAINIPLKQVADMVDITIMLEDPLHQNWTSGPISDELRGMLGVTYEPFIAAIQEITEILSIIAQHLNIQSPNQTTVELRKIVIENPPVAKSRSLRENFAFKDRLRFTMNKSMIKTNLARLEACTMRIDTWIGRAEREINQTTSGRSRLKFVGSLSDIQENASKIYSTLLQSWCKKEPEHSTFLLMEQRLGKPQHKSKRKHIHSSVFEPSTEPTCFKISIGGGCCPQKKLFHTELRVADVPVRSNTKVKITICHTQPRPYETPSLLPKTPNLCKYIQKPSHPSAGFCIDFQGSLRVYSSDSTAERYNNPYHTLEDVLPKLKSEPRLMEMYCLAITLVASVVQLSPSPWLDRSLDKRNIAFLRTYGDTDPESDIRYPYIMKSFSRVPESTAKNKARDCSKFLALAILLLEIIFGKSIEEMRRPEDLGNSQVSNEITDLQTADRWYKAERRSLLPGFANAVLGCLQEYHNPDANFQDTEYCDMVKEKVLQPLENDYQYIVFGS